MSGEDRGDSELLKSTDEHTYTTEPLMEVSYDHGRGAGETGDELRGQGAEEGEGERERERERERDGIITHLLHT